MQPHTSTSKVARVRANERWKSSQHAYVGTRAQGPKGWVDIWVLGSPAATSITCHASSAKIQDKLR
eukprot:6278429-Prymnesium_polylepis.1